MLTKSQITQQLIDKMVPEIRPTLDQALKYWWTNIRATGGLRLTEHGWMAFNLLEIQRWEHSLEAHKPLTPAILLTLDQKLTCPYYITLGAKPKLILFGSKEAVTLIMFGDMTRFLDMLSRQ